MINKHISIDFEKMKTMIEFHSSIELAMEEEILRAINHIESSLYIIKKSGCTPLYFKEKPGELSVVYNDINKNKHEAALLLWDAFK